MLKDLGSVLVENKMITQEQLRTFIQEAKNENKGLGQYLKENKIIEPEALAKAYSKQLEVRYFDKITEDIADPLLLSRIPFKFLRENVVMPVKVDDKIYIVTANPNNFQP